LSIKGIFVYGIVCIAASQTRPAPPEEVRIRSAIYSPPPLTLAAQANLVELAVTVRDPKDQAVAGLRREDFELFDRGERQAITTFDAHTSTQSAAPEALPARTIALFFDDTHGPAADLQNARNAAARFLDSSLAPGDRVGIFTTSGAEIVDFTGDRRALADCLARLRPHSAGGAHPASACPTLSEFESYVITHNLDANVKNAAVFRAIACNCPIASDPDYMTCSARQPVVVQSVAEMLWDHFRVPANTSLEVLGLIVRHLARTPGAGTRVLLLLSPGMFMDRTDQQASAIVDTALRGRVAIHAIDAAGLRDARGAGARQVLLEELMSNLATATGGRLFHDNNDVVAGIRAATAPPENSYLLGFSPSREPDDAYHPLKVRLTDSGNRRVETRPGYFAAAIRKESIQQRLDRIAASDERITELPVTVHAVRGAEQAGRFPIHIEIQVDARAIQFAAQQGRSLQQLTFVTVLQDASGAYVTGRQAVMDLALTPARFAQLKRDGIKAALVLYAPKGRYRLREVVREAARNHISASITDFELR
jgi:VWFA-related protein